MITRTVERIRMFKVVISLTILERKFDFEKNMRKMTKKSISLAKISHF